MRNWKGRAFAASVVAALWLMTGMAAGRESGNRESKPAVAAPSPVEYAGVDACKTCHEDLYKTFATTAHFKTTKSGGHGCESCHGPAGEHVAGGGVAGKIVRFEKLSRSEANARCLSCHAQKHEQHRFATSAHASNHVGCLGLSLSASCC
jgi:nitrate/TMAO reductase-like tetraheme cytochrome c subunit